MEPVRVYRPGVLNMVNHEENKRQKNHIARKYQIIRETVAQKPVSSAFCS